MEWWWKWKPKNLVVAQTSQLPWDSTTTGSINIHLHEIENWCCCDPRQPIDKGINKQFKTKIRTQHQEWMVNGQFIFPTISQGGKWSPSKELVLQWINWAWKETKTELVAQSFKSYSILKALNGTKDKAIRGEETGNWGKNRNNDFVDNQFQTVPNRRHKERCREHVYKCAVDPLHPNISMFIFHTILKKFLMVLTKRICPTIKSFLSLQSLSLIL